jgi:recombination protein RecR
VTGPLERLVRAFSRLPGIGQKTATRLAFHLLRAPEEQAAELALAIHEVRTQLKLCSVCCDLTDRDPCAVCTDPRRDATLLCVVAQPQDVLALERTATFRGRYHVLHGVLDALEGVGPEELKVAPLLRRLEAGEVREVVLATSPSVEGDATALYLHKLLSPMGLRVTRIASGIPTGGEIEYADGITLGRALSTRREM